MSREARIREKLKNGTLTRKRPRLLKPVEEVRPDADLRIGKGPAGICSGCDEEISSGEVYIEFRDPSEQIIRFHDTCERIWEKERHKMQTGDAGERRS